MLLPSLTESLKFYHLFLKSRDVRYYLKGAGFSFIVYFLYDYLLNWVNPYLLTIIFIAIILLFLKIWVTDNSQFFEDQVKYQERRDFYSLIEEMFSNLDGGAWIWDIKKDTGRVPEHWFHALEREELGTDLDSWLSTIHRPDKELTWRFFKDCLEGRTKYFSHEYRIVTKIGSIIWVKEMALLEKKETNSPRMVGLVIDITDMKKAEETQALSATLDNLLKESNIGSWVWDLEEDVLRWDKKAEEIYGLPNGVSVDNFLHNIHPIDKKNVENAFSELKKGKEVGVLNYRFKTGNNEKYLRVLINGLSQSIKRNFISGVSLDITDQVKQKEELSLKSRLLIQRNEELECFIYIASHDFQEPLRKISYFTTSAKDKYHNNEDVIDDLNRIEESCNRLQRLFEDLTDYSRIEIDLNWENFNLSEILDLCKNDLMNSINNEGGVVLLENDIQIKGDRRLWNQMLCNLISNALKYHEKDIKPIVKISGKEDDLTTEVYVEDNGIGVPLKYRDRIFEPFKRLHLKEEYPGTGIGLAIVKRIIERHKGKVYIKDSDSGSIFVLRIPKET